MPRSTKVVSSGAPQKRHAKLRARAGTFDDSLAGEGSMESMRRTFPGRCALWRSNSGPPHEFSREGARRQAAAARDVIAAQRFLRMQEAQFKHAATAAGDGGKRSLHNS